MTKGIDPSYERRLILFIDVLGFKEIVAATENDPAALRQLIAAMDDVGYLKETSVSGSKQVTQFSDSIVVSYRVDEPSAVFWLLNEMALTVVTLAGSGFLLRGAVTMGGLYHTARHVVGPAMVKAYEMESKIARNPRVIIDSSLVSIARKYRTHSPDEEARYAAKFMSKDTDGIYYFDYISWQSVVDVTGLDDDGYPEYLGILGKLIQRGLKHKEPSVNEKYLWLHQRYVAAIKTFENLPPKHPYRFQSGENCEAIASLPRFTKQAAAAKAKVEAFHSAQKPK